MKHFGIVTSLIVCCLLFQLASSGTDLLLNSLPFAINFSAVVVATICLYYFILPMYQRNRMRAAIHFIVLSSITLHFFVSLLSSFIKLDPNYKPETDFSSGLLVIPLMFIGSIGWGFIFDWKKARVSDR